jgi:signal peptidase II
VKGRHVILLIAAVVIADQALKIWIKTHYTDHEHHWILGKWFELYFIENEGMAYGWKFGGSFGKIALTLFRLGAVIFGVYYLRKIVIKKYHPGFIACAALIFAGALGNLIDSMFYGLIFEKSIGDQVARIFSGHGYAGFLHGHVVDMLHFPIIGGSGTGVRYPSWVPVWGGDDFEFFQPIFNLADASISSGVIALLIFQKKFFPAHTESKVIVNDEEKAS